MKNANRRMKHIADGDTALEAAGQLLHSGYFDEDEFSRANALIALARAHYRAVEVDILTKET